MRKESRFSYENRITLFFYEFRGLNYIKKYNVLFNKIIYRLINFSVNKKSLTKCSKIGETRLVTLSQKLKRFSIYHQELLIFLIV